MRLGGRSVGPSPAWKPSRFENMYQRVGGRPLFGRMGLPEFQKGGAVLASSRLLLPASAFVQPVCWSSPHLRPRRGYMAMRSHETSAFDERDEESRPGARSPGINPWYVPHGTLLGTTSFCSLSSCRRVVVFMLALLLWGRCRCRQENRDGAGELPAGGQHDGGGEGGGRGGG